MSVIIKTPGVYIEEISSLPPAVAAVDTAVPAFIGYTDTDSYRLKAEKVRSLLEFEEKFCDWTQWKLTYSEKDTRIVDTFSRNQLYYNMQLYFANGGGKCYVISLGPKPADSQGKKEDYNNALTLLEKENEPTLIVMPELCQMDLQSCMEIYQLALAQAATLKDRFVIMDVPKSDRERDEANKDHKDGSEQDKGDKEIDEFRNTIGTNNLRYGAAYYPHLLTSIGKYDLLEDDDFTFQMGAEKADVPIPLADVTAGTKQETTRKNKLEVDNSFDIGSRKRQQIIKTIKEKKLELPPSAAIAGVYARVDSTRGVWKAPANVSLNLVSGLVRKVSDLEQADLNVHPDSGKSINVIRSFAGKGIIVWGARTLAGNDNEWRYINVRRLYIFVEESVKNAIHDFVFEANDANTWIRVSTMVENFLTNLWRQRALAGSVPEEAFFVRVGLNTTMTPDDILNGIMNIEIGLAVVRPAEFIVLKFSHKLQQS